MSWTNRTTSRMPPRRRLRPVRTPTSAVVSALRLRQTRRRLLPVVRVSARLLLVRPTRGPLRKRSIARTHLPASRGPAPHTDRVTDTRPATSTATRTGMAPATELAHTARTPTLVTRPVLCLRATVPPRLLLKCTR